MQRLTEGKISEEEGGFRTGRGMCGSAADIFLQDDSRENISKRKKTLCMDLEKAYDRVDWPALTWDVLKIYGVGGKLLSAIKSFYEEASACVKVSEETSEHFEIKVGLRQGCVMSPWVFNIYMDGVMREMKRLERSIGGS